MRRQVDSSDAAESRRCGSGQRHRHAEVGAQAIFRIPRLADSSLRIFNGFEELKAAVGTEIGVSDGIEVTQRLHHKFA